ncbi:MAG: hypothetical protein KF861_08245, partial [Planctomycetaceae bacterium]|nr:hypothetical protein [Planctomycetaceae bacterium]
MTLTRDCPSPGDSATDFTGSERVEGASFDPDHIISDDTTEILWASPGRDDPLRTVEPHTANAASRSHVISLGDRLRRQRRVIIVLASYASAVTLALAILAATSNWGVSHELESLPD